MKNQKIERFLRKNSPLFLTILGAGGVVATGIAAARETPKALRLLEEAKEQKGGELTKLEIVVNGGRAYLPAIGLGVSTIICIFGANALNKKQQASLISAYNLLANHHNNYRNALISLHGEEADKEVRAEMVRTNPEYHQIGIDCPDSKCIWYEENSGRSIARYEREIMDAEYHFNRNFTMRGYATLNEWYMFLGLPETPEGDMVGWSMVDGYSWVDFEHYPVSRDEPDPQVFCITTTFPPEIFDPENY